MCTTSPTASEAARVRAQTYGSETFDVARGCGSSDGASTSSLEDETVPVLPDDSDGVNRIVSSPHSSTADAQGQKLGVLQAVLASVCFSAMHLCVRLGTGLGMSAEVHVFARGWVTIALAGMVLACAAPGAARKSLATRLDVLSVAALGCAGAVNMTISFVAVSLLPLPMATTIMFTQPAVR